MFNFFKKKKISIWPSKASESVASLALLIDSLGFPFTGWKHPDLEMSDYYTDVIKYACNSNQLFTYKYLFDDHLIGEIMLGCSLEIAKIERKELVSSLEFGVSELDEIMKGSAEYIGNSDKPLNSLFFAFAQIWEIKFCESDNKTEKERENLRNVMFDCLFHSRSQAINAFDPMIKSIETFDFEEIEQLSFREGRGFFEDVLFRRYKYPHLFKTIQFPNAQLLLDARRKEYKVAVEAENAKNNCLEKLKEDMESSGSDSKLLYDKFIGFLDAMDEIRVELKAIGGDHCSIKLKEITETRNNIFDSMTKVFVEYDAGFSEMMTSLRETYDRFYEEISNNHMSKLRYLDDVEIPFYILTLSDEVLLSLKEYIPKDEFVRHLASYMLDVLLDEKEGKEIYRKMELLG